MYNCIVFTHITGQISNKSDNLTMVEVKAINLTAGENAEVEVPKYVVCFN